MAEFLVGEWLPDQADLENPGAAIVQNVYPRTAQSYGPVGSLSATTNTTTNRCQGAVGIRDSAGDGIDIVGDSTALYYMTAASSGFVNISKTGGYSIATDEQWHFAQQNDTVYATNSNDNLQTSAITSGVPAKFADLATAAPRAKYMAFVKNFLVVANTIGGSADPANPANKPQRVWWPALGDPTNWPTTGTASAASVQSDFQDIEGVQGWITGIVENIGPIDAAVFFQDAVFRMMYVGAPDIFSFQPATGVKGCIAPGTLVRTPYGAFYLGPDGFYIFDGINNIRIGYQKVDKWFWNNLDQSALLHTVATLDPLNPIVWVAFPSTSSTNDNPDTILACNLALMSKVGTPGVWSQLPSINTEMLFRAVSLGQTLDQLDTVASSLDALPASLDSQYWLGNAMYLLAAFDTNHALNFFTGNNLSPTVETTELLLFKGWRGRVKMAVPLVDGGTPSITPGTRSQQTGAVSYGSAVAMSSEGLCPINAEGRYFRYRITLPSNSSFNHIRGVIIPDEHMVRTGFR